MAENVRVNPETHAKLKALAKESGQSLPDVLDEAVEAYRRKRFHEQADRAWAALQADEDAWREECAERRALEGTLADDLEGEPTYPMERDPTPAKHEAA